MDPLLILTNIAIVLMLGILASVVARSLRLPTPLVLILLGVLIGSFHYNGVPAIDFGKDFIMAIATFALIMLAFDASSRLKISERDPEAGPAMHLINWFMVLSAIVMSFFTATLFFGTSDASSLLFSILFAVIIIETDIGSVLLMFKEFAREKSKKLLMFLETEANLNTAFIMIIPFLILDLMADLSFGSGQANFFGNVVLFLYQVLIGIGLGLVIGLIVLKFMRKSYSHHFSPIAIISSTLIAYILADVLGGSGIMAVAVMGFIYGNVYVQGKEQLTEFSNMFSGAVEILLLVILGMAVSSHFSFMFIIKALLLFAVFVVVRAGAVFLALRKEQYTVEEKIFISLNMPKGLAMATVCLMLLTYNYWPLTIVVDITVLFIIFSIVLSYVIDFYTKHLLETSTAGVKMEIKPVQERIIPAWSTAPKKKKQTKKSKTSKKPKAKPKTTGAKPGKKKAPGKKPKQARRQKAKKARRR